MYENVSITEVIEHRVFQLKTTVDIMKRDNLGEKSCSNINLITYHSGRYL